MISASCSLVVVFSITTGIVKKLLKMARNKNKKHTKIVMLAGSSIESKISKALINNEISHEAFTTILNEGKNIDN